MFQYTLEFPLRVNVPKRVLSRANPVLHCLALLLVTALGKGNVFCWEYYLSGDSVRGLIFEGESLNRNSNLSDYDTEPWPSTSRAHGRNNGEPHGKERQVGRIK